jgi:hypothetical protein
MFLNRLSSLKVISSSCIYYTIWCRYDHTYKSTHYMLFKHIFLLVSHFFLLITHLTKRTKNITFQPLHFNKKINKLNSILSNLTITIHSLLFKQYILSLHLFPFSFSHSLFLFAASVFFLPLSASSLSKTAELKAARGRGRAITVGVEGDKAESKHPASFQRHFRRSRSTLFSQ